MTSRTATTTAIILSLAAASAPAASARPADFVAPSHQSPATVYSRPDKSMIPETSPATSGGSIDPAAALRSLTPQERQRVGAISALSRTQLAAGFGVAAPVANTPTAPQAVARVQAPQSGFDWGDAGIGAAGLALSVIGIGGAFAVSQRRSRRGTTVPS